MSENPVKKIRELADMAEQEQMPYSASAMRELIILIARCVASLLNTERNEAEELDPYDLGRRRPSTRRTK